MRVLLVRPCTPGGVAVPPLSLGYLAASLRPDHDVVLRDGLRSPEEIARIEPGFDAVCVTVSAPDVPSVRDLCLAAKRSNEAAPVILGGPHVSAGRGRVLREVPAADFAFVGEAEHALRFFLGRRQRRAAERGWLPEVPGLVWREGAGLRANPPPKPPDVESLAVAWDLMPPDRYPRSIAADAGERRPVAPLLTSRGCADACGFCAGGAVGGRVVRRRSVGAVLAEVRVLVREHGVRGLEILDDNFTGDRGYVQAFCEGISREFPGLAWTCPNGVRLEALDGATAKAMRRAGCVSVSVGIDACLTRAAGGTPTRDALGSLGERIRLLQQAGIAVDAYALRGVPGEAPEDAALKTAWACEFPLRSVTFATYEAYS